MKKVLFIKGNPNLEENSYSLSAGREFINEYKMKNPNDEIVEIDVYRNDIPLIDGDVLSGWGKLQSGVEFGNLTNDEITKISRMNELTEQFISAEKYVFLTPLWNFTIPAMMKAYVDTFLIAGKTFKYTEKGPVGLLNNKKAVHIQASGGVYSQGPASVFEHGNSYIKTVLGFVGVTDVESILIEGTAQKPKEELKKITSEKIKEVVSNF